MLKINPWKLFALQIVLLFAFIYYYINTTYIGVLLYTLVITSIFSGVVSVINLWKFGKNASIGYIVIIITALIPFLVAFNTAVIP